MVCELNVNLKKLYKRRKSLPYCMVNFWRNEILSFSFGQYQTWHIIGAQVVFAD